MTSHEAPFEERLRTALVDLRPVGGAPSDLRSKVAHVAQSSGPRSIVARSMRVIAMPGVAASLAVGAAIILLMATMPAVSGPATVGGVSPTGALFDPRADGPGLVSSVTPTLLLVPGVVSIAAVALCIRHLLRARWIGGWTGALQLLVLGSVAAAGTGIALHPGFEWLGGSVGPLLGYGVQVQPPPGSLNDSGVWYETVEPGEPLVVAVSITNPGPLPIRIEGLVEKPNAREMVPTRWVGMTTWSDQTVLPEIERAPSFTPVTVEPNSQLLVFLAAKAGECSFGPDFTIENPSADISGYATWSTNIRFAYSVFGLVSTAPFELPVTLVEPMRNRCPALSN